MYSFSYLEPVCCFMSSSNCCILTCIEVPQEAGQVVWYSHLFQSFPQFLVIHRVKGFGIVNKAEIHVFLELSCFFHDPPDVDNLISGSSAFSKTSLNIRKFLVHVLLKPGLENFECYFTSMWDECNCAVVWHNYLIKTTGLMGKKWSWGNAWKFCQWHFKTVAEFYTHYILEKYINIIINIALYLEKDLRFAHGSGFWKGVCELLCSDGRKVIWSNLLKIVTNCGWISFLTGRTGVTGRYLRCVSILWMRM